VKCVNILEHFMLVEEVAVVENVVKLHLKRGEEE